MERYGDQIMLEFTASSDNTIMVRKIGNLQSSFPGNLLTVEEVHNHVIIMYEISVGIVASWEESLAVEKLATQFGSKFIIPQLSTTCSTLSMKSSCVTSSLYTNYLHSNLIKTNKETKRHCFFVFSFFVMFYFKT